MITVSKTRGNKYVARGTGKITSAPQFRTFDSGKVLTSFFINSDASGKGKDKQFESYKINAWEEWADYANVLEKGDVVYVEGECLKDDYYSKKNGTDEFMINIQEMFIANIGIEIMHLRLLVDDMRKQLGTAPNGSKKNGKAKNKPNEQPLIPEDEFSNVDPDDMPWENGDDDYETGI